MGPPASRTRHATGLGHRHGRWLAAGGLGDCRAGALSSRAAQRGTQSGPAERNEKTLFLEKSLAASQQLKELADAMASLPEGQLRRQLQEERWHIYLEVVQQRSEDALISREQTRTFQRLADIYRSLKQPEEALRAQRSANRSFSAWHSLIHTAPNTKEIMLSAWIGWVCCSSRISSSPTLSRYCTTASHAPNNLSPAHRRPAFHSTLGTMITSSPP